MHDAPYSTRIISILYTHNTPYYTYCIRIIHFIIYGKYMILYMQNVHIIHLLYAWCSILYTNNTLCNARIIHQITHASPAWLRRRGPADCSALPTGGMQACVCICICALT